MKMVEKMNMLMIKAMIKVYALIDDERGDTNFISILVLLGIALALATVFLGFKDQVLEWVDTNIGSFFNQSGGRG